MSRRGLMDFFGLKMQQAPEALWAFSEFLFQVSDIRRVIEIGTGNGGLATLFGICGRLKNFEVFTFEINAESIDLSIIQLYSYLSVTRVLGDVFTDSFTTIVDLIKSEGTTVLLCDGGNKVKEFDTFAAFLKEGDWILAHDFHESAEFFHSVTNKEDLLWPNMEINSADVQNTCNVFNLKRGPLYKEFVTGALACFYKES